MRRGRGVVASYRHGSASDGAVCTVQPRACRLGDGRVGRRATPDGGRCAHSVMTYIFVRHSRMLNYCSNYENLAA